MSVEAGVEAGAEVSVEAGVEVTREPTREPTVERPSQVATSCEATPHPQSPLLLLLMWLIHLAMTPFRKPLS